MAENKKFNARIQLKNDISTNWDKATGFKPLPGEPIIVSDNKKKLKIGDGETLVKDLPYLLDAIPVVDGEGKKSIVIADGIASGDYSVAGGTTDGDVIKDLAGSLITPTLSEPEASGNMSLAFGANVKSTSLGTITLGYDSIAGVKGYYYHDIVFNDDGSAKIYLAKTQTLDAISTSSSAFKADLEAHLLLGSDTTVANLGWKAGDYISIVNDHKFFFCSQITNVAVESRTFTKSIIISTLTATVDCIVVTVDSLPFSTINTPTIKLPDDLSIFAISRTWNDTYKRYDVTLRNGIIELGWGALAIGYSNQALGAFSSATGYNNTAIGDFGSAEGRGTLAGYGAHSEGYKTEARGTYSHAEGQGGQATGTGSHVEGIIQGTGKLSATGNGAHAEGLAQDGKILMASGLASHAEGANTIASGSGSHAEGVNTIASNSQAHAEGRDTLASGNGSHAEGHNTQAIAQDAHAEGQDTFAEGAASHVEGYKTIASGAYAHAEGIGDKSDLENPLVSGGWKANVNLNPLEDLPLEGKINITIRGGNASSSDWIMFNLSNIYAGYTDAYTDEQGETQYLDYYNVEIYNKDTGWNVTGLEFNGNAPREFVNWLTKYFTASALELEGVIGDAQAPKGVITYITYSGGCASGYGAHSQNVNTIASGDAATSMGAFTQATANNAVSMGHTTIAGGAASLAGGRKTLTKGDSSLAFGLANTEGGITASGKGSIAMGEGLGKIEASGEGSVAIGLAQVEKTLTASGYGALALGVNTTALGAAATSTGSNTTASGGNSFATGHTTEAKGNAAFAEGRQSIAYGQTSHAEGYKTKAGTEAGNVQYESAHAEGYETTAIGIGAHAEGYKVRAIGLYSHAEGSSSGGEPKYYVEVGDYVFNNSAGDNIIANSGIAFSENFECQVEYTDHSVEEITQISRTAGKNSSDDWNLNTYGNQRYEDVCSPSEDVYTVYKRQEVSKDFYTYFSAYMSSGTPFTVEYKGSATGASAHSEGKDTLASGKASHAEGQDTVANGKASHAGGIGTIAKEDGQTVIGRYNKDNENALFIIGNGTEGSRENAFEVELKPISYEFYLTDPQGLIDYCNREAFLIDYTEEEFYCDGIAYNNIEYNTLETIYYGYDNDYRSENIVDSTNYTVYEKYRVLQGKQNPKPEYFESRCIDSAPTVNIGNVVSIGVLSEGAVGIKINESQLTGKDIESFHKLKPTDVYKFVFDSNESYYINSSNYDMPFISNGVKFKSIIKKDGNQLLYDDLVVATYDDTSASITWINNEYKTIYTFTTNRYDVGGTDDPLFGFLYKEKVCLTYLGDTIVKSDDIEVWNLTTGDKTNKTFIANDLDSNIASGYCATGLGSGSQAIGNYSFAAGAKVGGKPVIAKGLYSVAMGAGTQATGGASTALGAYSIAEGSNSFAAGHTCYAKGNSAIALGKETRAVGQYQTAVGMYNAEDNTAAFVVGVGTSSKVRANAFTTGKDTNGIYITIGNTKITETKLQRLLALLPTTFSFTIDGVNYEAEEGMTWVEWIYSDYNTGGYVTENSNYPQYTAYIWSSSSEDVLPVAYGTNILSSDIIIQNGEYSSVGTV